MPLSKNLSVSPKLGPDPKFFEEVLADDAVPVSQDGQHSLAKSKVVEAHHPARGHGEGPKFTSVEMSDTKIVDHGTAAVVTCRGRTKALSSEAR